jgi:DNA-binding transcriptional ArsR family regulator
VLEALADPTRRAIFELLAAGPRSVSALSDELPVTRPAVSQHLRVLREARLVGSQAEGTRRIYHVDPRGLADARAYLTSFWTAAMQDFSHHAEGIEEDGDD